MFLTMGQNEFRSGVPLRSSVIPSARVLVRTKIIIGHVMYVNAAGRNYSAQRFAHEFSAF